MKQHIVLIHPEIPQNTGNIARLCVALNATLHLVYPLGFNIDSKYTKRAGLDYWDKLKLYTHKNLESYFESIHTKEMALTRHYALSSKARESYFLQNLIDSKVEEYFLYFGNETKGFSPDFYKYYESLNGQYLTIPMAQDCRCLNLSNSVAIIAYDLWHQYEKGNAQQLQKF
ncbi:hypothetical protein CQA53_07755 [Helicobacter didelphidarum]|uniref:Putative tRNA (cytidine(34)-2'-O)-methyltransferase n=1 Tax=Helicobacter didelphidarum TaxID=2040648 RepID=A0A3D8IGV6_9HELI|nr:tRNA (cytidine(34)-2'-O)-methyltransferase [Helicobacter didelphidarum]RDU64215.1 hypothetical protein CQA53_07755 [Helicobacter didelphidarum]